MPGLSLQRRLLRHILHKLFMLYHTLKATLPGSIFPARYASPRIQAGTTPARLDRARRAALLGVGRMPQRPGLWLRTTGDGDQRIYRVKDHNGELYATVGRFVPVAVPTARMPGYWDHLD